MLNRLLNQYKSIPHAKQVLGLFSVNIIGIPMAIITSVVVTRYLGPKDYGDFQFIISIFNLAASLFTFGFFQAGNRALVLNNDRQIAKEYYGVEVAITGVLFIVMSIFLAFYAFFDPNIQEKHLRNFVFFIIPYGWIFLLMSYFEALFQADNRIRMLAQIRLYPKGGFLITAALIYFIFMDKNFNRLAVILTLNLTTQAIVYLLVLYRLQLSFRNIKIRLIEIWNYNKSFGFDIYVGGLFVFGFFGLTGILISYFGLDNRGVGFYALALSISAPLSFIPNTIATTHYKDFSVRKRIPPKLSLITLGVSFSALIVLWIVIGPFVRFFYGKEYATVITLTLIVSFGTTAHGLSDYVNRFLGANGQGKALRNNATIVGGSMLLFSLLFVPKWGEYGAAYARLITSFVYLGSIIFYYIRFRKKGRSI
jgi:O-antigen/teichoic acid export membrane protein